MMPKVEWTLVGHFVLLILQFRRIINAEMLLETAIDTEDPLKILNDSCEADKDCVDISKAMCDMTKQICVCQSEYPVEFTGKYCYEAKRLNESCEIDSQCTYLVEHSDCVRRVCQCLDGYQQNEDINGTLYCTEISSGHHHTEDVNYATLGVMIGMVFMFIVICVVLRMFSKAQFEERRSIFQDTRFLKMSLQRSAGNRAGSERRGSNAPSRQPSIHSGIDVPVKSHVDSPGRLSASRSNSFSRATDQVTVDVSGGRATPTHRTNQV